VERLALGELRVARVIAEEKLLVGDTFPGLEGPVGLLVAQLSPDNLVVGVVSVFEGVLVTVEVEIYLVI
jgi:hypothetical protein